MTQPRTIHRRAARKRARDRARAEQERWARLTPAERARETEQRRMWAALDEMIVSAVLPQLRNQLVMAQRVNREYGH